MAASCRMWLSSSHYTGSSFSYGINVAKKATLSCIEHSVAKYVLAAPPHWLVDKWNPPSEPDCWLRWLASWHTFCHPSFGDSNMWQGEREHLRKKLFSEHRLFFLSTSERQKAVRSLQWLFRYSHPPISHWWQPRERNHSSGPMFHQTPVFFHHSPSLIFCCWCNGCVSYWPFCLSCLPLQLPLFLSSPELLLVVPYRVQVESRSGNGQMTSFNLWTCCCLCSTIASCCYKSLKVCFRLKGY